MNFRMRKFNIIFHELPERENREEILLDDINGQDFKNYYYY